MVISLHICALILKVIEHLKRENSYTAAMTEHLKPFENQLYEEFLSHIKQTDAKVSRSIYTS